MKIEVQLMKWKENKLPKRGELWIADYNFKFSDLNLEEKDFTVESQIKKSRPCVIISNNIHNSFSEQVFTVPLTNDDIMETGDPLEVSVTADKLNNLSKNSKALVSLTNHPSKSTRLKKLIGSVSGKIMEEITEKLVNLIS